MVAKCHASGVPNLDVTFCNSASRPTLRTGRPDWIWEAPCEWCSLFRRHGHHEYHSRSNHRYIDRSRLLQGGKMSIQWNYFKAPGMDRAVWGYPGYGHQVLPLVYEESAWLPCGTIREPLLARPHFAQGTPEIFVSPGWLLEGCKRPGTSKMLRTIKATLTTDLIEAQVEMCRELFARSIMDPVLAMNVAKKHKEPEQKILEFTKPVRHFVSPIAPLMMAIVPLFKPWSANEICLPHRLVDGRRRFPAALEDVWTFAWSAGSVQVILIRLIRQNCHVLCF